jgi:hypothetical protein
MKFLDALALEVKARKPRRGGKKKADGSDYVPGSIFNDPKAWEAARRRNAARKAEAEMVANRSRPKTVQDGRRAWQSLLSADVRNRKD